MSRLGLAAGIGGGSRSGVGSIRERIGKGPRLPRVDTLVVGAGSSGLRAMELLARHHGRRGDVDCQLMLAGGPGLWQQLRAGNPGLLMGQGGRHLTLDPELARTPAYQRPFLPVEAFVKEEADRKDQLEREHGVLSVPHQVHKVEKAGREENVVTMTTGEQIRARRVFLCGGPGPQRSIEASVEVRRRPEIARRSFAELAPVTDFLFNGIPSPGETLLVYGGGPSAAWCVEKCVRSGVDPGRILWVASPEHGGFRTANPAGRNADVMRLSEQTRLLGSIGRIGFRGDVFTLDDPAVPGLDVELVGARHDGDSGRGRAMGLYCSRVIYALGSDPVAPGSALGMLDLALRLDLKPVFDASQCFGDDPERAVTALASGDGDVVILGAAASRALQASLGQAEKFAAIAATLPEPARPIDGIAMGQASIKAAYEALSNRLVVDPRTSVNLQIGDRQAIAEDLRKESGSSSSHCLAAADRIIEERAKRDIGTEELRKIARDLS